jgi:glycosyltransferase involved in cell wall biosynthesis
MTTTSAPYKKPAMHPATQRRRKSQLTDSASRLPICLVGPGWPFTSGISYYTCLLANAIAGHHDVSVIQLRQLLPRRFYPGKKRVRQPRARMTFPPNVPVFESLDWRWGHSLAGALSFVRVHRPKVLVLQWWTVAALHTYLMLAITARFLNARVVIEMHELQGTGEARFTIARLYGRWGLWLLLRLCHGCVVRSETDRWLLESGYVVRNMHVATALPGPFDQYRPSTNEGSPSDPAVAAVRTAPRPTVANLLFVGLIRPYKGLEDSLGVFNGLSEEEAAGLWLTVVGETWEGCTEPARLIETSPYRNRTTFVKDYVSDDVVGAAFAHADVVVLPYRRASSSAIMLVAMSWGLPIVVTRVGGSPEEASGYDGALLVPPGDPAKLKAAIKQAVKMVGQRFSPRRNWMETIDALLSVADVSPHSELLSDCDHHNPPPYTSDLMKPELAHADSDGAPA